MAISINTVAPVLAAQEVGGIAPELVLQPGSVVNAQVLKILSADLVRIAIASLSIDVASEMPLQQGQNLQLAVTQSKDGIRLAMVGQGGDAAGAAADAVTLSPDALADAASRPSDHRRPEERIDPGRSARRCRSRRRPRPPSRKAWRRCLPISAPPFPPATCRRNCRQAIAQVLAQQTSLDQNLDGSDIKTAFQKSGIFLEASLASGSVPPRGVPDLKAALIVLRQTLQSALGANAAPGATAAPVAAQRNRTQPCAVRRSSMFRKSCCRRRGCRPPLTSRCPATPPAARFRPR